MYALAHTNEILKINYFDMIDLNEGVKMYLTDKIKKD